MSLAEEDFEFLIHEGENYLVEFKESATESLSREMVAFANSAGGRIFLGVDDFGKIRGIKIDNRLRSRIQDIARKCDPPVEIRLEPFGNVLVVEVFEGVSKPYSCKQGFFIRVGANSQKLRRDEIIEFFQHEGRVRFDEQPNTDFDMGTDFSEERFRDFLQRCRITENLPPVKILENMGLIKRQGERVFLKNAGVLLFAKNQTKFFHHSMITCVRYRGSEKTFIIDRKDFREDAVSNLENALKLLEAYIPVKYEISGKTIERKEVPELPYPALREALTNAVLHRDYFEHGAVVMVEFFDDRVEISNPGGLIPAIPPEEFGLSSASRNSLLFDLFHRARLAEKVGTGINRIRNEMRGAGLAEPVFRWNGFFRVTFRREFYGERKRGMMEEAEIPEGAPITRRDNLRLNKILELIYKGKIQRRPDIEEIFSVSFATAQRDIAILKNQGLIDFEGAPKTGRYILTEKGKDVLRREEGIK